MSDLRTVIAVSSSTDADYNFLLPLTALLWRDHIGHHPLALLVGDEVEWKASQRLTGALGALDEHQIPRAWLGHVNGVKDATLAQNARQHAAAVETIFPETWALPADADLWPIRREFYQAHLHAENRATIYYWAGDHFLGRDNVLENVAAKKRFQTIPTCHVAMRAKTWREVYGIAPGEPVTEAVERTLGKWFSSFPRNDFNTWMSDQDIMTWKLCSQDWFPSGRPPEDGEAHASGEVLFVGRKGHPPLDRLDRSHPLDWDAPFDPNRWTDAHVHKSPASLEHWVQLEPIIQSLLPQHAAWAHKYHREYVEASR